MKKALSVLTAAAMLLSFFLILPQGKAAADVTEKETAIKELIDENVVISDGATLDYNGTSLKNGMAVIKVTLPKDEMVQFQQPITDFFDGTSHLNIGIGANAANDFNDARIRIRIAESTDITEPEKAAWNFLKALPYCGWDRELQLPASIQIKAPIARNLLNRFSGALMIHKEFIWAHPFQALMQLGHKH